MFGSKRGTADFLAAALSVVVVASVMAGVPGAGPAAAADFLKEVPSLEPRVARGELPPVAQRLPDNPLVVQPVERLGHHGGTWRMAMVGNNDGAFLYRTMGYEHLVRWDPNWTRVIPNVAQSYEVNGDATEFLFHLRKGMRWSDGHPFTAEDILFWYEDVLMNPELMPVAPTWLQPGGRWVEVEARGPYAVLFRFAEPNSLFLHRLAAAADTGSPTQYPKHWLKHFHPRYDPEGVAAEVTKAGAKDWVELFQLKTGALGGVTHVSPLFRLEVRGEEANVPADYKPWPSLNAWMLTGFDEATNTLIAERNPYYWKIDPAGQQLPYIDRLAFRVVADTKEALAIAINGEVDMQERRISRERQAMRDLVRRGAVRTFSLSPGDANTVPLSFNQTHPDLEKRALFGDRRFRIALSHAIDRRAIIDAVFGGDGEPFQVAPRPESRYYLERLARQYLSHDPARANALLDEIGLTRRDADGVRLTASGRRVEVALGVRPEMTEQVDALERVAADWRRVGIDARVQRMARADLFALVQADGHDVVVSQPDGGMEVMLSPENYFPAGASSDFGIGWVRWFEDPTAPGAVEPPADVKKQAALYRDMQRTTSPDEQTRIGRAILDITADRFDMIGISLAPERWGILSRRFVNVPRVMIHTWTYPTPAPTNTCQYFIDESAN